MNRDNTGARKTMTDERYLYPISITKTLKRHRPSAIQAQLRKLRIDSEFTQTELAKLLKVSCTTISNYETGQRECPADKIEAWANACGFIISFIIEED